MRKRRQMEEARSRHLVQDEVWELERSINSSDSARADVSGVTASARVLLSSSGLTVTLRKVP